MRRAILFFLFVAVGAASSAGQNLSDSSKNGQATLKWLGTAGWELSDGNTVILIDPYISRILGPQPPGRAPYKQLPGDTRKLYGWDDVRAIDTVAVDLHVPKANYVLVTHTHYDHVLDVPHIALKTHATVIGTESTANVLRAYGVSEEQLVAVRGGEDFEFGVFSVKVIPSIHSPLDHKHYFSSAVAPPGMKAPLTLNQMHPEGGTLAYMIRFHGHQILVFGGMNYIERELQALEPDVVLVGAAGSRTENYDYCGRLMRVLHFPAVVIPTHWDNIAAPYGASQDDALAALQTFVKEMQAASPKTRVIIPKFFEPIPVEGVVN